MKFFVDYDTEHPAPPDSSWTHVTTAGEAIELLERGGTIALSLDHDLGDDEPTGYEVVKNLDYRLRADDVDLWPTDEIVIHSANAVGVANMERAIEVNTDLERDWSAQKTTWRKRG